MGVSIAEFWKLLLESRLLGASAAAGWQEKFGNLHGGDTQGDAQALAEWLVKQRVVSGYQAKVLLAGHAGPFVYGDYVVYDRHATGRLKGTFKALHPVTRFRMLLVFHAGPQVDNPQTWAATARQIEILARVVHPQLGRVFQACDTGQYKFTALEYLRGQSADERLARGAIPWAEACRMVQQAAAGLAGLLDAGEIHGAVRPRNLWIDRQGNVRLLLPPLARDPLTIAGPIGGANDAATLEAADYWAPELAEPGRVASPQTEVYALGCTLYHLIAGRLPFSGGTVASKRAQHAGTAAPSLESLGAPAAVAQITAQLMAKDPAQRLRHPRHVAEALASILRQLDPVQLDRPTAEEPNRLPAYEAWLDKQRAEGRTPARRDGERKAEGGEGSSVDSVPEAVAVGEVPEVIIVPSEAGIAGTPVARAMRARKSAARRNLMIAAAIACALLAVGVVVLTSPVEPPGAAGPTASVKSNAGKTAAPITVPLRDPATPGAAVAKRDAGRSDMARDDSARNDPLRDHAAAKGPQSQSVADDGKTLWAPPTSGSPVSLEYVAPGVQAFLHLRPAELLKHPEGEKIVAAVGPQGEAAVRELEAMAGVPLKEVEQVTIAWVESMIPARRDAAHVAPMYVVRLASPRGAADADSEGLFQSPAGAAYLPAKDQGRVLVVGTREQIRESMQLAGAAPPLRRELEKILRGTDSARLVTFAFLPDSPGSSGAHAAARLAAAVRDFLGADARAAAVSAHMTDEALFLELRVEGSLDQAPDQLVGQYREQLAAVPESVESYLAGLNPSPYGKRVLLRFPPMLKLVDEFTRGGVEGDQAVLRCYLPATAAHNLLMAAELILAEGSSSVAATASGNVAAGGDVATRPESSVAERLQRIASLSFARDTLENALNTLAGDLGVKIEILGADLQAEGITKNQSFGLDERDKPAGEILRTIMRKASPDGKLVYVVRLLEAGGEERLVITTRAAAAKRGEKLPAELAAPPPRARGSSN